MGSTVPGPVAQTDKGEKQAWKEAPFISILLAPGGQDMSCEVLSMLDSPSHSGLTLLKP